MKNKIKLLKIFTIVSVIVFLIVACSGTKDKLNGTTWKGFADDGGTCILTFNSPNVTFTYSLGNDNIAMSGTYTILNDKITITILREGTIEGTISGDKLTLDGLEVTFAKQ